MIEFTPMWKGCGKFFFGGIILCMIACGREDALDTHVTSQVSSQLFMVRNVFAEKVDWLRSLPTDDTIKLSSDRIPESLAGFVDRSGPYVVDAFGGVIRFRVQKAELGFVVTIWSGGPNLIDESGGGDDIVNRLELEVDRRN